MLILQSDDHDPVEVPLDAAVISLGRAAGNDITVGNPWISERHAEFRWEAERGAWEIVDLDSHNGTMLAGKRIRRARLSDGDTVTFGLLKCTFRSRGAAVATTPPPTSNGAAAVARPAGYQKQTRTTAEVAAAESRLANLQAEEQKLRAELFALREAHEAASKATSTSAKEADQYVERLDGARASLEQIERSASEKAGMLAEAETELAHLRRELKEATAEAAALDGKNSAARRVIAQEEGMIVVLQKKRSDLETAMATLEKQRTAAARRLEQISVEEGERPRAQNGEAGAVATELRKALDAARGELSQLHGVAEESSALRDTIARLEGSAESAQSELRSLRATVAERDTVIATLRKTVEDLEKTVATQESALADGRANEAGLATRLAELDRSLTERRAAMESLEARRQGAEGEVEALGNTARELKAAVAREEKALAERRSAVEALEARQKDGEKESATLTAALVKLEGELASREKRLEERDAVTLDLAETEARLEARKVALGKLAGKVEESEQTLAHLQKQCDLAEERLLEHLARLAASHQDQATKLGAANPPRGQTVSEMIAGAPPAMPSPESLESQLVFQTAETSRLQAELNRISDQLWDLRCGSENTSKSSAQELVRRESELIEQLKQARRITSDLQFAISTLSADPPPSSSREPEPANDPQPDDAKAPTKAKKQA